MIVTDLSNSKSVGGEYALYPCCTIRIGSASNFKLVKDDRCTMNLDLSLELGHTFSLTSQLDGIWLDISRARRRRFQSTRRLSTALPQS
nr:hypothetical protein CFP56_67582 [Quercus suber]